ncbi:MAG: S8 family serine peptidase [Gemmatimonadaceae bacterium]|nr:S8 family serine peptidase [Gemmatimonadaceae bacterium]
MWIGQTDTRVNTHPDFSTAWVSGQSAGRQPLRYTRTIPGTSVPCSHGSRVASIIGSPRNGAGMQGVAWKANLYAVHFNDGVWELSGTDAYQAIADAVNFGSKVITMAWSAISNHHAIANLIHDATINRDVVFVGAAGTSKAGLSQNNVVFPAELSDVLAVSAADFNGFRDNQSHYGPELDIVAYQPTTSVGATAGALANAGSSSSATGLVGGVAALVRARYPTWTSSQVRSRLVNTAGIACGASTSFGPIVNAEAAVGGICVPQGRPIGPQSILFDHRPGDSRTSQTAQYCVLVQRECDRWGGCSV